MRKLCLAAASLTLAATSALADEVWDSEWGMVAYIAEKDRWAVWSYGGDGTQGSETGKIFLEGLAGVVTGRGTYHGYWMTSGDAEGPCPTARTDIDGNRSGEHGPVEVRFIDPDWPGRWRALWGQCDGAPSEELNGTPRTR